MANIKAKVVRVIPGRFESAPNFAFGSLNKAVAIVFSYINTDQNHNIQIISKHFYVVLYKTFYHESSC